MVPAAVLPQSKPVHITAVRPVSTVVPKTSVTRPKQVKSIVTKPNSPNRSHINYSPSPKVSNSSPRVTAVKVPMVNAAQGVIRFGKRGKLDPHYIRPFKILDKVGTVAYRHELPAQLSRVHSTFHVSNQKKCFSDEPLAILLDEIQIDDKLNFVEEPVEIIDREVKRLKQSLILIVKVRWNLRRGPEFTWEREGQMKKKYLHLFANPATASKDTS
nr:putative reverse transcriptase domain-containing protein [Tanacetum cinerariifolium]